jgi:hypothetical protein
LKFARRALDEVRWTGAWMIDLAADMEAIVDVWMAYACRVVATSENLMCDSIGLG